MPARQAILRINHTFLRWILGLPEGTEIIGVSADLYFLTDELAIKVSHPDLPETPLVAAEDGTFPRMMPTITPANVFGVTEWRDADGKLLLKSHEPDPS